MNTRFARVSPAVVTLGIAALTFFLLIAIRYLTPVRAEFNLSLYERQFSEQAAQTKPLPTSITEVVGNHPIYYRAERIAELSDVALCLTLQYLSSALSQGTDVPTGPVPSNVETLLNETRNSRLLPPGVEIVPNRAGTLNTVYSTLYVRYRARPMGIEIISVPRSTDKAGGLLMRVPIDPARGLPPAVNLEHRIANGINDIRPISNPYFALFSTPENVRVSVPAAAFAPVEELATYGWTPLSLPAPVGPSEADAQRLRQWMSDPK